MIWELYSDECGDPTFTEVVDKGTPQDPVEVTQYTYQFDPSVPSTVVTIKGGVVTDIK